MKDWYDRPSSPSIICSDSLVPSVVVQIACVSPRVNSAEPCVRGRNPTIDSIGRTWSVLRPSIRLPSLRIAPLALVGRAVSRRDVVADQTLDLGLHRRVVAGRDFPRVLGRLLGKVDDQV